MREDETTGDPTAVNESSAEIRPAILDGPRSVQQLRDHKDQETLPTMYLICGLPGSGKTTFASKLDVKLGAVRFSLDEWLSSLYGQENLQQHHKELEDRCKLLICKMARRMLGRGISVTLDFGFPTKTERDSYRQFAEKLGAQCQLCYLTANQAVLRRRVLASSQESAVQESIITNFEKALASFEIPRGQDVKPVHTDG
jgi:predicted kinase